MKGQILLSHNSNNCHYENDMIRYVSLVTFQNHSYELWAIIFCFSTMIQYHKTINCQFPFFLFKIHPSRVLAKMPGF